MPLPIKLQFHLTIYIKHPPPPVLHTVFFFRMKRLRIQQNNPIDQKSSFACIKSSTVLAHLYFFWKMILSYHWLFILRYQIYNYNGVNKTQFNILVYNVQVTLIRKRTFSDVSIKVYRKSERSCDRSNRLQTENRGCDRRWSGWRFSCQKERRDRFLRQPNCCGHFGLFIYFL